jgi:hypothetical protein
MEVFVEYYTCIYEGKAGLDAAIRKYFRASTAGVWPAASLHRQLPRSVHGLQHPAEEPVRMLGI